MAIHARNGRDSDLHVLDTVERVVHTFRFTGGQVAAGSNPFSPTRLEQVKAVAEKSGAALLLPIVTWTATPTQRSRGPSWLARMSTAARAVLSVVWPNTRR